MNVIELVSEVSKSILVVLIAGYILFLIPYFLTNNIPLQYDFNIISVLLVMLYVMVLVLLGLFCFVYIIDRYLKTFKYKEYHAEDIFNTFDSMFFIFAIIAIPMSLIYIPLFLKFVNPNTFSIFLFIIIPLFFVAFWYFKRELFFKVKLFINLIFTVVIIITLLIRGTDISFIFFLFFIFIIIIMSLKNSSLFEHQNIKKLSITKILLENKNSIWNTNNKIINKINLTVAIILILIIFSFYDHQINHGKLINRFTKVALHTLNIGEFKGSFIIDNNVAEVLRDVDKEEINSKYTLVKSHIVWSNDKYLFIKSESNKTIPIMKNFIPIDVIKIKEN